MSPRAISDLVVTSPPLLHVDDPVEAAVRTVVDAELPALPVVDDQERWVGIFGEREFMEALFPGYLKTLKGAAFLTRTLDEAIDKREACRIEPVGRHMLTEHVEVGPDFSDAHIAEVFLHHRVLVVPIVDDRRVVGLITRRDFFRALAERFLGNRPGGDFPA
jgi:CBS domain-containing protein